MDRAKIYSSDVGRVDLAEQQEARSMVNTWVASEAYKALRRQVRLRTKRICAPMQRCSRPQASPSPVLAAA